MANYVEAGSSTAFHASYPSESRVGLRVYVGAPDYVLAMKLRALRVGTRDEAGATTLAQATGITTLDAQLAIMQTYFLREAVDARRRAIIGRFATSPNDAHSPDFPG